MTFKTNVKPTFCLIVLNFWPLISASSALMLTFGAVLLMHDYILGYILHLIQLKNKKNFSSKLFAFNLADYFTFLALERVFYEFKELILFVILLALFIAVIFWVNKKYQSKVTAFCKVVQTFFNNNQLSIFSICALILFLNSLFFLSICESVIGFMILFNLFVILFTLNQEEVPFLSFFFVCLGLYRLFSCQISGYYLCLLALGYYCWNVISMIWGVPNVEDSVEMFHKTQEPVLYHMRTELVYFLVLDQLILMYLAGKYGFGITVQTLLGIKMLYIVDVFIYESLILCIVMKLVAIWVFNPGTSVGMKIFNSCVGCGGVIVAAGALGLELHKQSTTGNGLEPPLNWLEKAIQKSRWGVTASTAFTIDNVKIWEEVYRTLPPKVPGTDEADSSQMVSTFHNETNPERRRILDQILKNQKK